MLEIQTLPSCETAPASAAAPAALDENKAPLSDLTERRPLRLRERPQVVMECSVIAERYLSLGYSKAALDKVQTLRARCQAVGGDFTLLWHNSHLNTEKDREFFGEMVK